MLEINIYDVVNILMQLTTTNREHVGCTTESFSIYIFFAQTSWPMNQVPLNLSFAKNQGYGCHVMLHAIQKKNRSWSTNEWG
jgi:hypothetical protein